MRDVSQSGDINWVGCVSTELSGKRMPDWLQSGDILVAARGSRNYAAQIKNDALNVSMQAVAAPHFFVVRPKHNVVLSDYLAWFLNQQPCQRYFEQNAEGTLTKSIRRSVLENIPVAVPAFDKQHAIVRLANTLKQEQHIVEQLMRNGEQMLNTIVNDLVTQLAQTNIKK
jgi:restriction endonuclease S subunit